MSRRFAQRQCLRRRGPWPGQIRSNVAGGGHQVGIDVLLAIGAGRPIRPGPGEPAG